MLFQGWVLSSGLGSVLFQGKVLKLSLKLGVLLGAWGFLASPEMLEASFGLVVLLPELLLEEEFDLVGALDLEVELDFEEELDLGRLVLALLLLLLISIVFVSQVFLYSRLS